MQSKTVQSNAFKTLIEALKEILNDANNASLGEFVAGRLLNPYEVLLNKEFFEEVEYNYKKRVVKESINMLKTKHRSLIKYLNIPIELQLKYL